MLSPSEYIYTSIVLKLGSDLQNLTPSTVECICYVFYIYLETGGFKVNVNHIFEKLKKHFTTV
jgi:hypothetical protein